MSNNGGWTKAPQQEPLTPSTLGPLRWRGTRRWTVLIQRYELSGDSSGYPCRYYGWQNEAHPFSAAWTMTLGPRGPMMSFYFLPCQPQRISPYKSKIHAWMSHQSRANVYKLYTPPPYSHRGFGYFHLQHGRRYHNCPWRVSCCYFQNNNCSGCWYMFTRADRDLRRQQIKWSSCRPRRWRWRRR